jgi:hypothetical protein
MILVDLKMGDTHKKKRKIDKISYFWGPYFQLNPLGAVHLHVSSVANPAYS